MIAFLTLADDTALTGWASSKDLVFLSKIKEMFVFCKSTRGVRSISRSLIDQQVHFQRRDLLCCGAQVFPSASFQGAAADLQDNSWGSDL